MILTNIKRKNFVKFGKYYYKFSNNIKLIKEKNFLLLFNGNLYPDINLRLKDIFLSLKKSPIFLPSLKKFKGKYCGIFIDKKNDSVVIFNDQLGLNDIFYYYKNNQLIIANKFVNFFSIKNFSKNDLDLTALGEFLLYEHVFLDRTFIKNIKLLKYATLKKFDLRQNKTKEKKYWSYVFKEKKKINRNEVMKKLDILLRKSIKRIHLLNQNKRFLIGLSGGLDSRLLAKYAMQEGIDLYPFVFSNKNSDTFYISKKIAQMLNLTLKQLIIRDDYWKWKNKHLKYDPMMNIMYTSYYSIAKNLDKNKIMLTGFNGDNLFGSHIRKIDFSSSINFIDKINSKYMLKIKKSIISQKLLNSLNKDILKYKQFDHDWKNKELFNFESRQLRFIKNSPSFSFYGDFENNFSIFSDIDLVNFVLELPIKELFNCKLYHDFICKYHPELAKIRIERKPYSIIDNEIIKLLKIIILKVKISIQKKLVLKYPSLKKQILAVL